MPRGTKTIQNRFRALFTKENFSAFLLGALIFAGVGVFFWKVLEFVPFNVNSVCVTEESYHIHSHLTIMINGSEQVIPKGIGFASPTCTRPLHTHDTDGVIHVEYQTARDFTLGEFFQVWGESLNDHQVMSYSKDGTHELTLTVNGQPSSDWQNLILRDQQKIVINFRSLK